MMKWFKTAVLGCVVLVQSMSAATADDTHFQRFASRQKPGAITVRGVASHISPLHFTLSTRTRGIIDVIQVSVTKVSEKGLTGRISVKEGDHVGVRGFLSGRHLRAILIRIYPIVSKTKVKSIVISGTVNGVGRSELLVSSGGRVIPVRVTVSTTVRVGGSTGTLSQVRVRDRVQIRAVPDGAGLTALHMHIYRTKVASLHVQIRGTVTAVGAGSLTVNSGAHLYLIATSAATATFSGNRHSDLKAVHSGSLVTVYACCSGRSLLATSIHVHRTATRSSTLVVRGQVLSVSKSRLLLSSNGKKFAIMLTASTTYDSGAGAAGIRAGDQVSVRLQRRGSTVSATRIHLYSASRRVRNLRGVIISMSSAGGVVEVRGKRYQVRLTTGSSITINGVRAAVTGVHPGDRATIVGIVTPPDVVEAQALAITRKAPRAQTIRGIVQWSRLPDLVVTDTTGAHRAVRLQPGVKVLDRGVSVPATVLFPGARVRIGGHHSGKTLIATSITTTAIIRTLRGRVIAVSPTRLDFRDSRRQTVSAYPLPGMFVVDAGRRLSPKAIRIGVYLAIRGVIVTPGSIRALAVSVDHRTLNLTTIVAANNGALVVQGKDGEAYRLRFDSSSLISFGNQQIDLKTTDIPVDAHVRVSGTMQTDGTLLVTEISVRLVALAFRGHVTDLQSQKWSVATATGTYTVMLSDQTNYHQGSHALAGTDVVVGEDITVHGYGGKGSVIYAHHIEVHRRLVTSDGVVAALNADGFSVQTAGGVRQIITEASTIFSGGTASDLAVQLTVHVTGYLRGDGMILATRVKLIHKKKVIDALRTIR